MTSKISFSKELQTFSQNAFGCETLQTTEFKVQGPEVDFKISTEVDFRDESLLSFNSEESLDFSDHSRQFQRFIDALEGLFCSLGSFGKLQKDHLEIPRKSLKVDSWELEIALPPAAITVFNAAFQKLKEGVEELQVDESEDLQMPFETFVDSLDTVCHEQLTPVSGATETSAAPVKRSGLSVTANKPWPGIGQVSSKAESPAADVSMTRKAKKSR